MKINFNGVSLSAGAGNISHGNKLDAHKSGTYSLNNKKDVFALKKNVISFGSRGKTDTISFSGKLGRLDEKKQYASPQEVLQILFNYTKAVKGSQEAFQMLKIINGIVHQIESEENQNILLLSHILPDNDALGSILALKNAIKLKYPDKNVVCAIDDQIPSLFKNDIKYTSDAVKRPVSDDMLKIYRKQIKELHDGLKKSTSTWDQEETARQINVLEARLKVLSDEANILKKDDKFDLVMILDTSTPQRLMKNNTRFKKQVENANKIIFIDHHQPSSKWESERFIKNSKIDMRKIQEDGLSWVAQQMPAAASMAAVIIQKMFPRLSEVDGEKTMFEDVFVPSDEKLRENMDSQEQKARISAMSHSMIAALAADTSKFARKANLSPEEMQTTEGKNLDLKPKELANWFAKAADTDLGDVLGSLMYGQISLGNPELDSQLNRMAASICLNNTSNFNDIGLNVVTISHENITDLTKWMQRHNPEAVSADAYKAYKHSPLNDEFAGNKTSDDSKISLCAIQTRLKGALDDMFNKNTDSRISLSFRSTPGTNHAKLLAMLFGGGGHDAAASGAIQSTGVIDHNTRFSVLLDGKEVTDSSIILSALKENYDMGKNGTLNEKNKRQFKIIPSDSMSAKTYTKIVKDIAAQIRRDDEMSEYAAYFDMNIA